MIETPAKTLPKPNRPPHPYRRRIAAGRLGALCALWLLAAAPPARANQPGEPGRFKIAMTAATPPGWIRWLGWSADSREIAWRDGAPGTWHRSGDPCWTARLDDEGAVVSRARLTRSISAALGAKKIRRRGLPELERLTPRDTLLRASNGTLVAVVLRGDPPVLGVLVRQGGEYVPVTTQQVRGPADTLLVEAFESPDNSMLAITAVSGVGDGREGVLYVLPLKRNIVASKDPRGGLRAATPAEVVKEREGRWEWSEAGPFRSWHWPDTRPWLWATRP